MESMQSRFRVKVLQPDIPDYAILILELLSTKLSDFHRILGSCSHLFLLSFVGTTFLKFIFKVSKKTFHCYSKWNLPYLDCPCHKVVTTCDLTRLWVTPTLKRWGRLGIGNSASVPISPIHCGQTSENVLKWFESCLCFLGLKMYWNSTVP